jgi:hypothetical protein
MISSSATPIPNAYSAASHFSCPGLFTLILTMILLLLSRRSFNLVLSTTAKYSSCCSYYCSYH